jgi:hypothetical protein
MLRWPLAGEAIMSLRFKTCMSAAAILTVAAGTWMALLSRQEEAVARIQWRREMDAKYGAGVVGEGRGSEYSFAGSIAINSVLVGMFAFPIAFMVGGGAQMLRKKSE